MNEEQFLCLLFIKNKGHKYNAIQMTEIFDCCNTLFSKGCVAIAKNNGYKWYYITPKGKKLIDSITPVLNLI